MFLLLVILLSISVTASFASMITSGTLSIAGTIYVTAPGGVTTPGGTCPAGSIVGIFFQDTATPAINDKVDIAPVGRPNGDIPLAIAGLNAGNIFKLMNPPDTEGTLSPPEQFLTFNNAGITTALDIDFIAPGVNGSAQCGLAPAPGQLCTPPDSLFNLQNLTATSSSIGWRFQGITSDSASTGTGTFTSQFNTVPLQTVLAALATNGFVSNTFAGQITLVPIAEPEPLSYLLLGCGMIAGGTLLRRVTQR
jgi:hypothetical protein